MLKVRFPNGQCITYNDAYICKTYSECYKLYTQISESWIANIPLDCIVEAVDPCKIENPIIEITIEKAFQIVEEELQKKTTEYPLATIKRLLKNYNINTGEWKED